jgi:hypothetical protein
MLSFLAAAESYQLPAASHARGCAIGVDCRRGAIASMGFLDGAKDVFAGDKPVVAADRVTPFDRWLGLDKDLMESEAPKTAVFIDPTDAANYFSVELAKPMGIAFVDNDGECGGVYVDEVLDSGSAAASAAPLQKGDQLVGAAGGVAKGKDVDAVLGMIGASQAEKTKLVFYRGPTTFLYGPTQPADEWYVSEGLV